MQKSVEFLHASSGLTEREIRKTISFTVASKKNEISRNKPNQRCKWPVLRKLQDTEERNWRYK